MRPHETTTRQKTRVIVLVDSHNDGPSVADGGYHHDLSLDCIAFNISKSTKAMGRFQIQLVPRRNYLNLIFPNDVVNIYVDPGDGKRGFVRLMLGYVDRVERQETTDENGATSTRYIIIGSDFQKAIDKTSIYFNGYMKTLLDDRFVRTEGGSTKRETATNFAGIALRNAGLTMFGSPADFVENILHVLLGYNQQWQMPDSYRKAHVNLEQLRKEAVDKALKRLPSQLKTTIYSQGTDPQQLQDNIDKVLARAAATLKETPEATEEAASKDKIDAAATLHQSSDLLALQSLLRASSDPSFPIGIHDLLNTDFIETLAVDGFHISNSIVQTMSSTLAQLVYGHCNGIMNELIFDLRPVSPNGGLTSCDTYSTDPDELGINTDGCLPNFPVTAQATKYVPAIIFREYPYSVVEKIDLSNIILTDDIKAGLVKLGPVFALHPNKAGRHVYEYDGILHPQPSEFFANSNAKKHIDVVVIHDTDVVSSSLGRSDEDVFNIFQMYANSVNATAVYRDQLNNFCPLINQVSVARHGLRVREETTDFANYAGTDAQGYKVPRRNLIRWQILFDHWNQHNIEYLSGSITVRGMPELRVGYRLDWYERNESYYVDSVSHQWTYPNALQTTADVSRGQRNDPFPAYIPPMFLDKNMALDERSSGDRTENGRLALYFRVKDTQATANATTRTDNVDQGNNITDTAAFLDKAELPGEKLLAFVQREPPDDAT
jgi:hypothetical protein